MRLFRLVYIFISSAFDITKSDTGALHIQARFFDTSKRDLVARSSCGMARSMCDQSKLDQCANAPPMRYQCAAIGINALLINRLVWINGAIMEKSLLINGIRNPLIALIYA